MAAMNRVLIFLLLMQLLHGCAMNPVSGKQDIVLMSEKQEIAIGRRNHPQILAHYGRYDDPDLQAYVTQVGNRLAAQSHRSELVYRFTVLDSDEVNAFALPGGYIYITRGLMAYLNSEAELAAVLGHEIGHVTARHSVRQQTAATAAGLGYTLASIFVPELGNSQSQNLYGLLSNALLSGYGREHELEADRLGAEYLQRTGRDPGAMLTVIGVLKEQEQFAHQQARAEGRDYQGYHGLFATHPDHDTRLQEVVNAARLIQTSETSDSEARATYLAKIDGMVFGDSAHQGIRRGNHFHHAPMGFSLTLPEGWSIKNLPDRIIAIAPAGKAQLQIEVEDINKRISPREFIHQRLGLKHLQQGRKITANGLDGYSGLTPLRTQAGNRTGRVSVVYLDQQAYIFTGAAVDESIAARVDEQFLDTARSLHRITTAERKLAQPLRLQIATARRNTNYMKLAAESPIDSYAEAYLRLLNGHYPTGQLQAGTLYKIVD